MNDKSNQYALAALKRKRGDRAGDIQRMKGMLACRQEQLAPASNSLTLISRSTRSRQRSHAK
jgi:hypothetical protein